MTSTLIAYEAHEFSTAVAGVSIDFTRIDDGFGPALMTSTDTHAVLASTGGVDFSVTLESGAPEGWIAVQRIDVAPDGTLFCGRRPDPARPNVYAPGTPVLGALPAGGRVTTILVSSEALGATAETLQLDLGDVRSHLALDRDDHIDRLVRHMEQIRTTPRVVEADGGEVRFLDSLANALAGRHRGQSTRSRRLDSGTIVRSAIDHVEATQRWQPTMTELCHAAAVSQSRLRAAFVEVFGTPPTEFFQARLLSRLREQLGAADPARDTVTEVCISLGLSQFGRVAGRYRARYGELPSETLRRTRST